MPVVELLHNNLHNISPNGSMGFPLSAQLSIFTLSEFCTVILIILLGHVVMRLHPVSTVAGCTFDGFSIEKSKGGNYTCGGRKPGTSFLMFHNLGLGRFSTGLCTVCILSSSQPPGLLVVSSPCLRFLSIQAVASDQESVKTENNEMELIPSPVTSNTIEMVPAKPWFLGNLPIIHHQESQGLVWCPRVDRDLGIQCHLEHQEHQGS